MPRFLKSVSTVAFSLTGGTPGAGKVLTSDSSGNGTWETPSGAPPADGSITTAKLADTEITLYVKLNAEVFG
jgi:hypothetical protein